MHYLRCAERLYYGAGREGGCFGLYSSLSFDLTVTSIFLPLLRAKPLHVFGEDIAVDSVLEQNLQPGSGIDSVKLTPSHISLLPHSEPDANGRRRRNCRW